MRYNDIFIISILVLIVTTTLFILILKFIQSPINIIMSGEVNNSEISIKLNIKYLFNLINIKIPLYPPKNNLNKSKLNKVKKKEKIKKKDISNKINKKAIEIKDIKYTLDLIFKIKIEEIYSDINIGNENINFTCFIYVLVNTIYGNIISIAKSDKVYLNITPNFTQRYIRSNIKLHIKPTIKNIISISIAIFKIYKKTKVNKKDGGTSELNRVNTKSYGKNI